MHPQYNAENPWTSLYKRLVPDAASPLFQSLCGNGGSGACTFPPEVTLSSTIACHGRECFLDKEIVYIKIVDPVDPTLFVFFQFAKPLCVQMAFYKNPKSLCVITRVNNYTALGP